MTDSHKDQLDAMHDGVVMAVRGSIVDIRFTEQLPDIHTIIYANDGKITLEVVAQLSTEKVRTIALTPTQGLARGMIVQSSHGPLKVPIGPSILTRMFNVFGEAIDGKPFTDDAEFRSCLLYTSPSPRDS